MKQAIHFASQIPNVLPDVYENVSTSYIGWNCLIRFSSFFIPVLTNQLLESLPKTSQRPWKSFLWQKMFYNQRCLSLKRANIKPYPRMKIASISENVAMSVVEVKLFHWNTTNTKSGILSQSWVQGRVLAKMKQRIWGRDMHNLFFALLAIADFVEAEGPQ